MKEIPLTKGMVALVDDADFDFVNQWNWYACHARYGKFYARRDEQLNYHRTRIYLHRVLSGAKREDYVDHRNGNTLDNQRCNLRICTQSQNAANAGLQKSNTSGFKGVAWDKTKNAWVVQIKVNVNKQKFLGRYADPVEGAKVYDVWAEKIFGEFAVTNKQLGIIQ